MQDLAVILDIPEECPQDFYKNPEYLEKTKSALEVARSLVHTIDDDGKKQAAADAAAIRKYVKRTNLFTKTVFESLTERAKSWRDLFTSETKLLDAEADKIIEKFGELETKKRTDTEILMLEHLAKLRIKSGIREEFITRPVFKITLAGWLTPTGALTKKSVDLVTSIVTDELNQQRTYDARCNVVTIQCLENDMAAFSPDILGEAMFAEDAIFELKLRTLIDLEKDRMIKQAARIERDKQMAVEKALKDQQYEADRIAKFNLEQQAAADRQAQFNLEQQALRDQQAAKKQPTPAELRALAQAKINAAERASTNEDRNRELEQARQLNKQAETRLVRYVKTYQARVKSTTTNEMFMTMIEQEITESGRAKAALISGEVFDA